MILDTAYRNMIRSGGRTWLTLIGMAISAAFMTLVLTSNSYFGRVISAPVRDLAGGDVLIMPDGLAFGATLGGALGFRETSLDKANLTEIDPLRAAIGTGSGVVDVSEAFLLFGARVDGSMWPQAIMARDFASPSAAGFADRIVEGRPLGTQDEGQLSIIVGQAESPTYKAGDVVAMRIPQLSVVDGRLRYDMVHLVEYRFTVVGLYTLRMPAPGQVILMPMSTFRQVTGLPSGYCLYATAYVRDFNHEAETVQSLRAALPAHTVYGPQDLYQSLLSGFSQGLKSGGTAFVVSFTGLMYILSALIIGNTLLVAAAQRRREIAIMKAMGMGTTRILLVFVVEGVLLSLSGALMGFGVVSLGIMAMTLGKTDVPLDVAAISLRNGLTIVLVTTGAAVVASLLPAIAAARTDTMEVLRYE